MVSADKISVIVPIHAKNYLLDKMRKSIFYATTPIEVFYVIEESLPTVFTDLSIFEKIIKIKNRGRGFMILEGIKHSTGDIILILHSDSVLPKSWDKSIRNLMIDKNISGGVFKRKFDQRVPLMEIVANILNTNYLKKITSYGDRGLFARAYLIKNNLSVLEVPIMEDVQLSHLLKKNGFAVLNKYIVTSSDAFIKNGSFRQILKIYFCLFWYEVGGNLQKIYSYYYSKS